MTQPRQAPARRLALFDLDGTLTRRDTFFPFVVGLLLHRPGRWPRALLVPLLLAGDLLGRLDRGGLKGGILHALFSGMPREAMHAYATTYAAGVVPARMFPEAVETFRGHLEQGDHVVVLSASPDLFVPDIAQRLGAHEVICTQVRWDGGRLDGRLASANRRDHEKARVLQALRVAHPGLPVIAYGNSPADLIHMRTCEEAVYINAGPGLAARLRAEGIRTANW